MKKLMLAIMLALMLPLAPLQAKKTDMDRLAALVKEYRGEKDFDCVSLGGVALSLIRGVAKAEVSGDADAMAALNVLKGVNHLTIVDFESCTGSVRDSFAMKVKAVLSDSEVLMEAKDGESSMILYGDMDPDGKSVRNIVMFAPQDCALICIQGKFSVSDLGTIAGEMKKKK